MIVKSKVVFGNTTLEFEVDERDDKVAMLKAISLASPRTKCNVCNTDGLDTKYVNAREHTSDKGTFQFISVRCGKCGSSSNLGEYTTKNGYFYKEYVEYKPKDAGQTDKDYSA